MLRRFYFILQQLYHNINNKNNKTMKKFKLGAYLMSALILFASCGANNFTKGGLIGGGGGALLGAGIGALTGHGGKGVAIGAGAGAVLGTAAGLLIGKKMDKAKAAAEAVQNAQVETVTDNNGLEAVKVTFDSGILFNTGSYTLSKTAQSNLADFTNNVLKVYPDCDVAIQGYTDNTGFKNSTVEQSQQKNLALSQNRSDAVRNYLLQQGASASQIKSSTGYGEQNPVADNSTAAGKAQNRRVEIYLYASQAMIDAANAGTLQ